MKKWLSHLKVGLWIAVSSGLFWGQPVEAQPAGELSTGQSVYVPVYSHIYQGDRESPIYLAVTLSIRNVDPRAPITVLSADYHDFKGSLLKKYQEGPAQIPPTSSIRYVVPESDKAGGSGAFFLVTWRSEAPVNPPLLESIMIGTKSQQGISFTSRGQVLANGALEKADMDGHTKILRMAEEWVLSLTSGNIEKSMALFTEDVIVAGGGKDEVHVGRGKARELLAYHMERFNVTACSLRVLSVNMAKDWAEMRGQFRTLWQPKKQGVVEEKEFSNYIWLLKRQTDRSWKIARFLFYPAQ